MNEHHDMLRMRRPHQHNRVTFVELFYDLVFVFAVTQLSHTLMGNFTWAGIGTTTLLLLAVWCTWIYTTWATNWLDPENYLVRILLFAMMLAGLLLSSSIPEAFNGRGLVFAVAYVFMQVGRSCFVLWTFRGQHALFRSFQRIVSWLLLSGLFWIAGGFAEGNMRVLCWSIAISLEFLGPAVRYWTPMWGSSSISDWEVEGSHIAERCGLFIIIALGESLLVTGSIFSELTWDAANVSAFIASFVGSLLLWWLYFDSSAEAASRVIAEAPDSGRLARSAYTYCHIAIVADIILLAVADEFVLAHPTGHTNVETTIALLGGVALYLIGNLLVKWTVWHRIRVSHLYGLVALLLLIPASTTHSPLWMMIATSLLLLAIAGWEAYYYRRNPLPDHAQAAVQPE